MPLQCRVQAPGYFVAVVSLCSIDPRPTALFCVSCLLIDACTPPAPHVEITGKKREQRRPGRILPPAWCEGYHLGWCPHPSRCRNCRLRPAHPGPTSFHGPRHREKRVSAGPGGVRHGPGAQAASGHPGPPCPSLSWVHRAVRCCSCLP